MDRVTRIGVKVSDNRSSAEVIWYDNDENSACVWLDGCSMVQTSAETVEMLYRALDKIFGKGQEC